MHTQKIVEFIELLRNETKLFISPAATQIKIRYGTNPYLILVSCILSLRTKDTVSFPASVRLFEIARTPQELIRLTIIDLEKLIYPVGFYRRKSVQLQVLSQELIDRFYGQVPQTRDELLSLTGVGIKTANLVLGEAFGIPAICVDIHVHRLSNQFGLVQTKSPEETEKALQKIIPKEYWIEWNKLLVMLGQNIKAKNIKITI